MMYLIRVESQAAVAWLEKLINNTVSDPNSHAMRVAYNHIETWKNALDNKMSEADILQIPEINELIEAEKEKQRQKSLVELAKAREKLAAKKTTRKKSPAKKSEADPYTCPQHPKYKAARSPRTDCTKCWALYKQFHPLDYQSRRSAFVRNQKKQKI